MESTARNRQRMLGIYLNDHLMGAGAGAALGKRVASNWSGADKDDLSRVAEEIVQDRASLIKIMKRCDITVDPLKVLGGRIGEKVSRLKPNARLLARSPLSSVEEVEMLQLGVLGKSSGWRTLRHLAQDDPRLNTDDLDLLIARAAAQADILERVRVAAAHHLWEPA